MCSPPSFVLSSPDVVSGPDRADLAPDTSPTLASGAEPWIGGRSLPGPAPSTGAGFALTSSLRLCWQPTRRRPAFVPRTTGKRQETTRTAGVKNRQVRQRIRLASLVARSGSRTLSRWRHGFKSRWYYNPGLRRSRDPESGEERLYASGLPQKYEALPFDGVMDVAFIGSTAYPRQRRRSRSDGPGGPARL
jgi:hypothetical protein